MILGIDLGGAETPPAELLSVLSRECDSCSLNLYIPRSRLPHTEASSSHHRIIFAEQEIGMDEDPVQAIRSKKDSSLLMGLQDLKEGKIQAFLSLANTGALVVASSLVLGRMEQVHGPALVALFPSLMKEVAVLDLGAYPKHTADRFLELVFLGSLYAHTRFHKKKPLIGLLNIGHESTKGTTELREADALIKSQPSEEYEYIGFIEPIDIFRGRVDVAVTDGFTGNVLLKTAEGAQEFLLAFHKSKKVPQQAALLLGVLGDVYKCHGRTSPEGLSRIVQALSSKI